jgi:hypothetical protein
MPVDSPDGTGGLINILCYKSNNFAGDFVSHFGIEIETCEQCGGAVKVIASIDKLVGKPICTANTALQGLDTGMCLINIHW